jgi:hypothetical protein
VRNEGKSFKRRAMRSGEIFSKPKTSLELLFLLLKSSPVKKLLGSCLKLLRSRTPP